MLLRALKASECLDVQRFDDIDRFRMPGILGRTWSTPLLKANDFAAAIAQLRLPDCIVTLQRSFPRIADAEWQTSGVILVIPMDSRVVAQANGVALNNDMMLLVRGQATFCLTEAVANLFSAVRFTNSMQERGWPETENGLQILRASPTGLSRLQRFIADLFMSASQAAGVIGSRLLASSIQDDLLCAIDMAIANDGAAPVNSPVTALRHTRLVNRLDEIMDAHPEAPYYTEALARQCGASPRTLHTAVTAVRGMSLHRYVRIRRLWRVRRQLASMPQALVRDIAIANGFWHLGEFAGAYRGLFGETPSATQQRQAVNAF